jgi:hypothetical protein
MALRMRGAVVRRPSVPLTLEDERQLAALRQTPELRAALAGLADHDPDADVTEASLLHSVLEAGFAALLNAHLESGYAELASEWESEREERRSVHRRRSPHAAFGE